MPTLRDTFPEPGDLLALAPEDVGAVLVEFVQYRYKGDAGFTLGDLAYLYFNDQGGFQDGPRRDVLLALAESVSWLESQGVLIKDPRQPVVRYLLTRRGRALKSKRDVELFRKSRALPAELLQPGLAEKVHGLFLRGDHDVAVFQAFKEVEVAVRKAGNYSNEFYGKTLMEMAFSPKDGPLRDRAAQSSEQQAEMFLFAGAMGHAKNPIVHREVNLTVESAARLIVFASHLLGIVHERVATA